MFRRLPTAYRDASRSECLSIFERTYTTSGENFDGTERFFDFDLDDCRVQIGSDEPGTGVMDSVADTVSSLCFSSGVMDLGDSDAGGAASGDGMSPPLFLFSNGAGAASLLFFLFGDNSDAGTGDNGGMGPSLFR